MTPNPPRGASLGRESIYIDLYYRLQENTGHSVNSGPIQDDHWRMMETFYVAFIKVGI